MPYQEHSKLTNQFLKLVRSVADREGWREYDVFTKWLEAATCALMNPVLTRLGDKERWDQNEERYLEIVRSCSKPYPTMNDLASMLGIITLALEDSPKDFIGPVFMEVAANSNMGQFFTPTGVSEFIARMSLHNARGLLYDAYINEGRTFITLAEPACGVGGMVLAANQVLREQGLDIIEEVEWTCVDVDYKAACGAFIQLNLTGASAVVVHGNSITLETWRVMPTMAALLRRARAMNCTTIMMEGELCERADIF
ncbi:MAG: N-6 DNA methylase [Burkholderiaceae bacterium]|nr:N-6 DNA methylase [Burkholderiaceae bacterium]